MPVSKTLINEQILRDIAQTIREGTNSNEGIVPSEFCGHIKHFTTTIKELEENKKQLEKEKEVLHKTVASLIEKPQIKTCTVKLSANLELYLHGYSATTYSDGKFYCNYILPQSKECYNTLTIENVVSGSILTLTISAKKFPIKFKGAECLEYSEDFKTYLFKVKDDTDIYISN